MPDNPTLSAYCVSLFFENTVALAAIVAGSEAEAVAQVSVQTARQHDRPLVGIGVMRLDAEWMRFALKTLESGEPHKTPAVSLVSDNVRPPMVGDPGRPPTAAEVQEQMALAARSRCTCPGYGPIVDIHNTDRDCPLHGVKNRISHLMPAEAPDPA